LFSETHPEVVIDVQQLTPDELMTEMARRGIDLMLAREPARLPDGCEFIALLDDRYAVVSSAKHPLAGRPGVKLQALAEHAWLMPPQSGSIAARVFQSLWGDFEVLPRFCWVTSRSPLVLWTMLTKRQLLAFTPYNIARPWIDAGVLVEIQTNLEHALPPLGAVLRIEDRLERGPATLFIETVRKQLGDPMD
jgi:DNA-binding transcriptional LysR family regulator